MTTSSSPLSPAPTEPWAPSSWRAHPAAQQPDWPDVSDLERAGKVLAGYPPLVFSGEARELRDNLARVAAGEAFLLQAGDGAESFEAFSADSIRDRLRVILQMSIVLTYSTGVPVLKAGRIAGQYAKARSADVEDVGGPPPRSVRGPMVTALAPAPDARIPARPRLLTAYRQSSATLTLARAFTRGGFADLSRVHAWNQESLAASAEGQRYEFPAAEIDR